MNNKPLIKQLLREGLMSKSDKDIRIMTYAINFAKKELGLKDDFKVYLAFERTPDLETMAYYNINGYIKVYVKNRQISDCVRSGFHEICHVWQHKEGLLTNIEKDGADGSDIENFANAKAGELMRKFNKIHPEMYD